MLSFTLGSCVRDPESETEKRISAVEQGLLREFGDPFWTRMDLSERMAYYNTPGVSVAVIDNFEIDWAKGYGVLAASSDEPVTAATLFQVASLGKPVVAAAALHQVETGALALDQDVNESLVSWQLPENEFTALGEVTLRRLLSHSAGVTVGGFQGYAQGEEIPTLRQILDGERPANSPPIRVDLVPGTQERYSGGGYVIVQQLLEDVAGRPFADILQETVLEPWGMASATFESPLPERLEALAASGHRASGATIPGGWHIYPEMGSGASMWASASDLARFSIQVMRIYGGQSDPVLSPEMVVQMLTPQIGNRGLGPSVFDDGDDLFYFMHPGANEGYRSVMVAYPHRGQGVVILTNSDNGEALWREILNGVSDEYGWTRNYTWLYAGAVAGIVIAVLGLVALRRARKGK